MLALVTNRARGARGFHTADGGTVMLEPGEAARLDLADHASHRAWEAAGEVTIEPRSEGHGGEAAPASGSDDKRKAERAKSGFRQKP